MTETGGDSKTDRLLRGGIAFYLLCIILAMSPYTLDATGDIKTLITHWAAAILGCAWAFGYWIEGRRLHAPHLLFVPMVLYLALHVLSALASPYAGHSLPAIGLLASYVLLYAIAAHAFPSAKSLTSLLLALIFAVAFSSAYAVAQRLGYDTFPWADTTQDTYRNLPGTFGNPNVAGHTMILAILAAAYLSANRRLRWCAVFALVFVFHLYCTGHRAGLLALAGSVAFALAIKFSGGSAHRVVTIVTLLGLLAVSAGLAYTFSSSQRLAPLDSSILLRYNGYFGASKMIAERPFLGSGPSSYVIETPRFWTPYEQEWFETRRMMNEHVHNDVLESAVELGLGGALLYLAIFAIAITASMALAQKRESPCDRRLGLFFGCFFVAYGIDGLFGFNIRMPVSGCLFFVTAGALEGQFLERLALAKSNRWAFSRLVRPVAAVCVALALAYLGTRVHLSEIRFFEGKGFVNAKRYAEADGKFASAEARAPWNWRPARERGLAAYYEGDYERAIEHLERSADRNPYWIMTLVPLANINLKWATELFPDDSAERIDALADARKFANDAWELSRGTATAAEVAARATYGLAKEGEASGVDWTEAKEILERSLALEQENAPTLRAMLADANKQLGQEAEALAQFLLAASGQPEVDSHWERLYGQSGAMETYSAMRDELDSAIALGREVSLTPSATMASLLQWRARVLEVAYGDSSAAARDYEDARHLAPRDAALWGRYAGFASRNDRMAEFRKAVLNAHGVTGHAGPIPAIEALAAAWNLDEADTARAAQLLATAVEAPVVNGETLSGAAQFGWAVDLLLLEIQAASPAPHDAGPILYCLGRVYRAIQNYGQAAAMFGAAAGLLDGPEKLQCQRYWAEALVQTGKGHDAILMLRQALKTEPSQHALRRFLARILKRSGRIPEARAEYERLLRTTTLSVEDRAQLQRELSLLPN